MTTITGEGIVVSKHTGGQWNFVPLTDWMNTTGIKKLRAAIEMRSDSGSANIRPGYAATNDKDIATASMTTNYITGTAVLSADGIEYGGPWDDVTDDLDGKMYVRFGVWCSRDAGSTGIAGCFASIRIDYPEI